MPLLYTFAKSARHFFESKPPAKKIFLACASLVVLLNVLARMLFPGQILDLDYNLFQPDGICYTKQAFNFAGVSSSQSSEIIIEKYRSLPIRYTPDIDEDKCKPLEGRILYPLISAPFVMLFGVNGMLISSAIIFLVGLFFCFLILLKFTKNSILAITLVTLVSCSSSILRWGISNTTDGLLFTLSSAFLFVFLKLLEQRKKSHLFIIFLLLLSMMLTKRSFYIPLIYTLLTLLFYLLSNRFFSEHNYKERFKQLGKYSFMPSAVLFVSIILDRALILLTPSQNSSWIVNTVLQCIKGDHVTANPGSTFSRLECDFQTTTYFYEILQVLLQSLLNIGAYFIVTLGQIFVLDKILFFFVANYFLYLIIYFKRDKELIHTLVAFFPLLLMFVASLNSTLGLNFRLELPSIPTLLLAALFSVQFFNRRLTT